MQITFIGVCLLVTTNAKAVDIMDSDGWLGERWLMKLAVVYGVVLTTLVFAEACMHIFVLTSYVPGPGQTFWCDVVG